MVSSTYGVENFGPQVRPSTVMFWACALQKHSSITSPSSSPSFLLVPLQTPLSSNFLSFISVLVSSYSTSSISSSPKSGFSTSGWFNSASGCSSGWASGCSSGCSGVTGFSVSVGGGCANVVTAKRRATAKYFYISYVVSQLPRRSFSFVSLSTHWAATKMPSQSL